MTHGVDVNSFSKLVNSLGLTRLAILGVTAVALLGFFAFIGLRMSTPPMALLYSDIGADDAAKVAAQLDAMKVPYDLRGDGTMIYVPEDRVLRLRMNMAEKGIPSGGTVGYEIFDNADALGTTSFLQNINQLRALEGELSRTIRSLEGIESARVHLVLPERELFSRDKREPSASIVLKLRNHNLGASQVKSVQYLVASAIEGMKPGHVSIVDEKGTLLASGMGDEAQGTFASSVEEQRTSFESRMRAQVEDIVSRVVGASKARVEVTAQMDYNRVTQTSDVYDPNGQVVRSTQSVEDSSANSDGRQASAGVTVGAAMPNANLGGDGGTSSSQSATRSEETINYEISRTTRTETLEPGRVKRISVAVLVDGNYEAGKDGATTYTPRSAAEIQKIEALVKSAIGFDAGRNDHVEVVNLRFAPAPSFEEGPAADAPFLGLTKSDYMRIAETAILSILALIAMFFVLRPLLSKLGGKRPTDALALADQRIAMAPQLAQMNDPAFIAAQNPNLIALTGPDGEDTMIDIAQVVGKVKHSSVRKIGELVNNHPDESVSILRSWLHEPA